MFGARFYVTMIWFQPYSAVSTEKTQRARVVGSLASGRTGQFNECSHFRPIASLRLKSVRIWVRIILVKSQPEAVASNCVLHR